MTSNTWQNIRQNGRGKNITLKYLQTINSMVWVRERTIPTEHSLKTGKSTLKRSNLTWDEINETKLSTEERYKAAHLTAITGISRNVPGRSYVSHSSSLSGRHSCTMRRTVRGMSHGYKQVPGHLTDAPLPHPSSILILSSASCPQAPSLYGLQLKVCSAPYKSTIPQF
jgi:hypothetical protein